MDWINISFQLCYRYDFSETEKFMSNFFLLVSNWGVAVPMLNFVEISSFCAHILVMCI